MFAGPVASFADANTRTGVARFVARINWGDGHVSVATVNGSSGSFVLSGRHKYARTGHYVVRVVISMRSPVSAQVAGAGTVVVSNPPRHVQRARIVHRNSKKPAKLRRG